MTKVLRLVFLDRPQFLPQDITILIFRILVSVSMINTHGMKKILDFDATVIHIPDPFGFGGEISAIIAVIANIIAPIFIILGLGTRLAALQILSVTLVGFFIVHANDTWAVRDVPFMYSLAFALLFFFGSGKYSLDHFLSLKK